MCVRVGVCMEEASVQGIELLNLAGKQGIELLNVPL